MRESAPCNSQTPEQVEAYYRNVKPGDLAMIRCTQGNILEYRVEDRRYQSEAWQSLP
ncbi:hypothetical protein ABIA40_005008 [Bradyrhizobium sp. USDA 223]